MHILYSICTKQAKKSHAPKRKVKADKENTKNGDSEDDSDDSSNESSAAESSESHGESKESESDAYIESEGSNSDKKSLLVPCLLRSTTKHHFYT